LTKISIYVIIYKEEKRDKKINKIKEVNKMDITKKYGYTGIFSLYKNKMVMFECDRCKATRKREEAMCRHILKEHWEEVKHFFSTGN